jgi:ketosteroid isomerase-like protein
MRAYNSGDSATLEAMYAPDAEYISGHVKGLVAKGRARLIANFQNGIRMGGHIDSISVLSIHSDCDLATLLCEYEATNSGQKAIGRTLLVVKKTDKMWRIVLHMTVV